MSAAGMKREHPRNRKTGLILAAVALAFFVAIMLNYGLAK